MRIGAYTAVNVASAPAMGRAAPDRAEAVAARRSDAPEADE